MKTSVVIPTYNGAQKIMGILKALELQTVMPDEIIVMIDGSTDNTAEMLGNQIISLTGLRIIEQENKGRAAVRNRGAAEATGDLLIFFDDDMLPTKDCINGHIAHYKKHPGSILTGGLNEEITSDSSEMLKFKSFLSNKWNSNLQTNKDGQLIKSSIFITGANFSVSKTVFNQLGGFDERLNDAEDFDLAVRACKSNIPLFFKSDVFAWHNDVTTCQLYIKRQRQYLAAHKQLMHLKPWLKEEGYIKPSELHSGWKKRVFRLFLSNTWIKAVDKNWLRFLPTPLRYKLYDLIITANGVYYPNKVQLR